MGRKVIKKERKDKDKTIQHKDDRIKELQGSLDKQSAYGNMQNQVLQSIFIISMPRRGMPSFLNDKIFIIIP
jgi:hypothetical protein